MRVVGYTFVLLMIACQLHAFDIDVIRIPLSMGTGTQDIIFSNFDEDCTSVTCAALFFVSSATSSGTAATDSIIGIGFTDGTRSHSVATRIDGDAVTSSDTFRGQRTNTELIHTTTFGGTEGYATFSAWFSNGLQINIADDFPEQYLMTVVLMGGSNLSAYTGQFTAPGTIGLSSDITDPGFLPSIVFLSGVRVTSTGDAGSTTANLSFGFAVNDGFSTQGSIGCFESEAASTMDPRAVTSSLYALQFADSDADSLGAAIQVGSWDASGFSGTLQVEDTSSEIFYLALAISGIDAAVVDISTPITTGTDVVAVGFQSLFGMILGTLAQAYDTGEADSDAGACMIGMATADSQFSYAWHDEDGGSSANAESVSTTSFILMEADDGSCSAGSCFTGTLTSFGATQWNLSYTSVFSDVTRKWVGLAIESSAAGPAPSSRRHVSPIVFR